ncbi:MAG: hypothetical protein ACR2I5_00240, partial [Candidatus Limnocylindria bacterium]
GWNGLGRQVRSPPGTPHGGLGRGECVVDGPVDLQHGNRVHGHGPHDDVGPPLVGDRDLEGGDVNAAAVA